MTKQFATLMGNIKTIETNFLGLSNELNNNTTNYDSTIKELIKNLDILSAHIEQQPIDAKNVTEIKKNFKNLFQIYKKLEQALKTSKKDFDNIENNLNKIVEKIKSKAGISVEHTVILNNAIEQLTSQFNLQKQLLLSLFNNLSILDKINTIKQLIARYNDEKEVTECTKQVVVLIDKIKFGELVFTTQTELLLEQLNILTTSIMQLKTEQLHDNPERLLTQFALSLETHKIDDPELEPESTSLNHDSKNNSPRFC